MNPTLKTYTVTMQSRSHQWECKTQSTSKFEAMLSMNIKYGHDCMAIDAKEEVTTNEIHTTTNRCS